MVDAPFSITLVAYDQLLFNGYFFVSSILWICVTFQVLFQRVMHFKCSFSSEFSSDHSRNRLECSRIASRMK